MSFPDTDMNIYRPETDNSGKEMIEELNSDVEELHNGVYSGFSKIDMRSRLSLAEIPAIMCVDFCVSLNALPFEVGKLTRSKKRLAVSLNGLGRTEVVSIIKHDKEQEEKTSMIDGMKK